MRISNMDIAVAGSSVLLIALLVFMIGTGVGEIRENERWEKQCIARGYAELYVNEDGCIAWRWKDDTKWEEMVK